MTTLIIYLCIALILPLVFVFENPLRVNRISKSVTINWSFWLVAGFLLTVILRGIAYDTGTDWAVYCDFYRLRMKGQDNFWGEHIERFFYFAASLLAKSKVPVFVFFTLFHIATYYSILKFSKLFYYCVPAVLLLWYPFMFSMSCNIYRQYLSMAFFLIACYYLLRQQYVVMVVLFVLSVAFHTIAFIYVPILGFVWWLYKRKNIIDRTVLVVIIVASHIMGINALSVFDNISKYISLIFSMGNGNLYEFSSQSLTHTQYGFTYSWLFLPIHIYWTWEGYNVVKRNNNPYFKFVYYFGILFFILFPISHEEFLMRVSLYFEIFLPFMLGTLYYFIKKRRDSLSMTMFLISILPNVIRFLSNAMFDLFKDHPYDTIFSHGLL